MIRVVHKQEPPELDDHARRHQARLRLAWHKIDASDPREVADFIKRHEKTFDRDYRCAWPELRRQWYGRCAYCSAELRASDPIDHFRPRRGGYWWLTWTWLNLLPACPTCNNAKGDQFPVEGPRLAVWDEAVDGERAELINPSREDPSAELEFAREHTNGHERWTLQSKSVGGRGAKTIEVLGLDRDYDRYNTHLDRLAEIRAELERARDEGPDRLRELWRRKVRLLLVDEPGYFGQPFPALSRAYLVHHFGATIDDLGLELPSVGDCAMADSERQHEAPSRAAGLSPELELELEALGAKPRKAQTQALLVKLVALRAWTLAQLAELMPQQPSTLRKHVRELAKTGVVEVEGDEVRARHR